MSVIASNVQRSNLTCDRKVSVIAKDLERSVLTAHPKNALCPIRGDVTDCDAGTCSQAIRRAGSKRNHKAIGIGSTEAISLPGSRFQGGQNAGGGTNCC